MPRTQAEIDYTNASAAAIGYEEPPGHLHPTGILGKDPVWVELVDWFRGRDISGESAIMVYISRRFDVSIQQAYADTEIFSKGQNLRIEKLEFPDEHVSGYN